MIDFPHTRKIVELVKSLNLLEPGSIKLMEKMVDTLAGTSAECNTYEEAIGAAKANRQKGRIMITFRTATVMIKKKRAADLSKFYSESSRLSVTIPKEIKELLDKLPKD